MLSCFSCVQLFVTLWTHPASLSMGFPRQEYWSGLPCPSPRKASYATAKLKKIYTYPIYTLTFFKLFVLSFNDVVIISREQQSGLVIHIHVSILLQTPLPSTLPHNIEQSSYSKSLLVIHLKYCGVYMLIPNSLTGIFPMISDVEYVFFFLLTTCISSLEKCVFLFLLFYL